MGSVTVSVGHCAVGAAEFEVTAVDIEAGSAAWVRDRDEFERFYAVLRSDALRPVVVVTVAHGDQAPRIDVDELERQLGDSVHLYVLSAPATFWLTDHLGSKTFSVHSGWARVYPSSPEWQTEPDRAPSFRPITSGRHRTEERIVDAALHAAFRGGTISFEGTSTEGSPCSAVVDAVMSATQVLVRVDGGSQAVMRAQRLATGLSADRLVYPGQRFSGRVTPMGIWGEFTPDAVAVNQEARAVAYVGDGIVTSVVVAAVTRENVRLLLHPDVEIEISAGAADEYFTTLASEGDVVTVELIRFEDEFLATFSAEEPEPAMSYLAGGPPWVLPQPVSADHEDDAPIEPALAEEPMTADLAQVAALEDELERLEQRHQQDEATIRQLQRALRINRKLSVPVVYRDTEQQLRLELYLDYLVEGRRTGPDQVSVAGAVPRWR